METKQLTLNLYVQLTCPCKGCHSGSRILPLFLKAEPFQTSMMVSLSELCLKANTNDCTLLSVTYDISWSRRKVGRNCV